MFHAISPVAKVVRSVAEALRVMQAAMRTVPVSYTHLTLPTNREV